MNLSAIMLWPNIHAINEDPFSMSYLYLFTSAIEQNPLICKKVDGDEAGWEEDLKGIIIMMSVFTKLNKSLGGNKKPSKCGAGDLRAKGSNNAFCY